MRRRCEELKQRFKAAFRRCADRPLFRRIAIFAICGFRAPHGEEAATRMVGKTDEELLVISRIAGGGDRQASGAGDRDIRRIVKSPSSRRSAARFLRSHIDPVFAADGSV